MTELPYSRATSGQRAIDDIQKILQGFGCKKFGHMIDFDEKVLMVQFEHHDRKVSIKASMAGYAAAWLRVNPWNSRRSGSKQQYEEKAMQIASVAVYSILRDWIKGQLTAIEIGMLSFDGAFLGQIMLPSGETVLDAARSQGILKAIGSE